VTPPGNPNSAQRFNPHLTFAILCAAVVILGNLQAWQGYFQGDDLDTLGWTRFTPFTQYLKWTLLPLYMPEHFRPVGHFLYWLLQRTVGLNFVWYLGLLQALHLINVYLVWRLLRVLNCALLAAGLGALFFSFHMAVIDAYWKPQFFFDVLCATFSLACLILFIRRRFLPAFICFWLAYKSKELAVMLPFVLATWEYLLGEKRWKPLLPFLAAALCFGLQGVIVGKRHHEGTIYALHFTWNTLAKTASFYFSKIFLARYAGFALLAVPFFLRDKRAWLGLAIFGLFLVPLLPLRDRQVDVYLYLPLTGLSVMLAAAVRSSNGARVVAVCLGPWLIWNYAHAQSGRRHELLVAAQNQAYVQQAQLFTREHAQAASLVIAGWPPALASWGALGAFRYIYPQPIDLHTFDEAGIGRVMSLKPLTAGWQPQTLTLIEAAPAPLSFLTMTDEKSVFQLEDGWGQITDGARWILGRAHAVVYPGPGVFECTTRLRKITKGSPGVEIRIVLDGQPLGAQRFQSTGEQTMCWSIETARSSARFVEIIVGSGNPEPLAQVVSFGFKRGKAIH
jgi:hypothetical protein